MSKAVLIICFILTSVHACTQNDSNFLSQDTAINRNEKKSNSKTLKTIAYATGYAGTTLLCYRYLDTDIKDFAQSNQNETVTSIAKTFEQLGTGTTNIIITAATGVTSLITKNKKLQKTTILLIGGHIINDIVTNQIRSHSSGIVPIPEIRTILLTGEADPGKIYPSFLPILLMHLQRQRLLPFVLKTRNGYR